jgi:two-component system, cell cycle sensor histidine kinase and response regulator CckA
MREHPGTLSPGQSSDVALTAALVEVLGRAKTLPELLQPALVAFCGATTWQAGQSWIPDEDGEALVVAPAWHAERDGYERLRAASAEVRLRPGEGLPGRVWRSSLPQWIDVAPEHTTSGRGAVLAGLGLSAALGVPVCRGSGELFAVLEFFTDDPPAAQERDMALASILGAHLAALVTSRRNEERLSESEARFRAVADTAGDAIVCGDTGGRITYVNHCAERLFGGPASDLVGEAVDVLVPALAADERAALVGTTAELAGRRRDGVDFPLEVSLAALEGPSGVEGFTAVMRDLTLRRREHAALERTTQQLVEAQRIAGLGSWEWDMVTDRLWWSEESCRIYGVEPPGDGLHYRDFVERIHPEDRDMVETTVQRAYESAGRFSMLHRIVRADDEVRTVQGRGEVVVDDDRVIGMIGTALDVTDRLDAERERVELEQRLQEAERLESIGRLAGGVAHDFNNLLTVILSYTSHLRSQTLDDADLADAIDEIRQAAEDGAALTRQLLTFSRRDPGEPRALDVNDVVRARAGLLRRTLGEHVEFELELCEDRCVVELDRGQLEQILMNLTLNARDALGAGGRLRIATGRRGDDVTLSVTDSGVGMSPAVRARAFEPFYTTKPRGKGTGLGLASVHGIVKRAGGDIGIRSRPGEGTVVTIELPASAAAPDPVAAAAGPAGGTARGTVLVVEDQPAILALAQRALVDAGYRVQVAADGEEALAAVDGHAPDLLLTDVVMPGMSGADLARRMRERFEDTRVLFISGHPYELLQEQGVAERDAVLLKPFTPGELLDAVTRALLGDAPAAAV